MQRFVALFLFALLALSLVPYEAQAQIPFFDPDWHIVPNPQDIDASCPDNAPLGFGAVLAFVQNVMNAAVAFGLVIVPIVIAIAGLMWMLSPTNPENRTKARNVIMNAVIGIIIVLAAWLVVDFVMKLLYVGADGERGGFGPWNSVLTGGDACVKVNTNTKPLFSGNLGDLPGAGGWETGSSTPSGGGGGGSYDPRYTTSGACSPTSVSQAGQSVNITTKEATFLACIARPESQCGADLTNYQWGRGSSAYGPFMILLDSNAQYFETSACRQAAGVTGQLNCGAGFRGGNPIAGSEIANRCMKAAANLACSTSAATAMVRQFGARPWTGNHDSKAAHRRCAQEL